MLYMIFSQTKDMEQKNTGMPSANMGYVIYIERLLIYQNFYKLHWNIQTIAQICVQAQAGQQEYHLKR